jgi:hypothetical protein
MLWNSGKQALFGGPFQPHNTVPLGAPKQQLNTPIVNPSRGISTGMDGWNRREAGPPSQGEHIQATIYQDELPVDGCLSTRVELIK